MKNKLILTCEHGGAQIPKVYRSLFRKHRDVLKTHRGLDIGALAVAKDLEKILKTKLYYSKISRLLVDLNRPLDSETLFSEMTRDLPSAEKKKILALYRTPHWRKIENEIQKILKSKKRVVHVAVHSMTHHLNGKPRKMQLALLYNQRRPGEKKMARLWIQELQKSFPRWLIAENDPYDGDGPCLPTSLRQRYSAQQYVGFEIEMNQKMLKGLSVSQRRTFSKKMAAALAAAIEKMETT